MTWRPDRLLRVLLAWTTLTTLPFWLILVRGAFDGPAYQWGLFGYSGVGVSGDYWLPVAGVLAALAMLILGWRGARAPFHWLLLAWHLLLAGLVTYGAVTYGDQFRFQGDTLRISVPLGPVGVLLFGGFAILAAWWVYRDLRSGREPHLPPWTSANRWCMWGVAALLPLQFLLLRFGPPDGIAEQIGVVVTVAQWFLLSAALKPWVRWSPVEPV